VWVNFLDVATGPHAKAMQTAPMSAEIVKGVCNLDLRRLQSGTGHSNRARTGSILQYKAVDWRRGLVYGVEQQFSHFHMWGEGGPLVNNPI
jgi:hypothetical protein